MNEEKTFEIRRADERDACALAFVHAASWRDAYADILSPQDLRDADESRFAKIFAALLQRRNVRIFIALDNGTACGELILREEGESVELVSIYTLRRYWGKGLGAQLMKTALAEIGKMRRTKVFLWVFEENRRARAFYEKFGFAADGERKESNFSDHAAEIRYRLEI